jgi:hypothetical protein
MCEENRLENLKRDFPGESKIRYGTNIPRPDGIFTGKDLEETIKYYREQRLIKTSIHELKESVLEIIKELKDTNIPKKH